MKLKLHDTLLVLFNLFPLALVLDGTWHPFDMMAFYWLELVVIGGFAVAALFLAAFYKLSQRRIASAISDIASSVFFSAHFGFFIVMLGFIVGSYLPEGTETRALTDPLVPAQMVLEHAPLTNILPMVFSWQMFVFITGYIVPRQYAVDHPRIMLHAYKNLFVLFISGFVGIMAAMATHSLLWGACLLAVVKTLVAYASTQIKADEEQKKETAR